MRRFAFPITVMNVKQSVLRCYEFRDVLIRFNILFVFNIRIVFTWIMMMYAWLLVWLLTDDNFKLWTAMGSVCYCTSFWSCSLIILLRCYNKMKPNLHFTLCRNWTFPINLQFIWISFHLADLIDIIVFQDRINSKRKYDLRREWHRS